MSRHSSPSTTLSLRPTWETRTRPYRVRAPPVSGAESAGAGRSPSIGASPPGPRVRGGVCRGRQVPLHRGVHGEAVVVRRNLNLVGSPVQDRLVDPVVTVLEL